MRRLEPLDLQVRLRGEALDPPQDVGDVLLVGQHLLQVLEPAAGARATCDWNSGSWRAVAFALGDVGAQRGQTRLPQVDVGLHLGDVEVPEPEHRARRHEHECADLRPTREVC